MHSSPLALEGIDLRVVAHVVPNDGEAHGTLTARDQRGVLAEVRAQTPLRGVWPPSDTSLAALSRMPLEVTLQVPQRRLETLPALLRPRSLTGSVRVNAQLDGSVVDPRVRVQAFAQSLKTKDSHETLDRVGSIGFACDGHVGTAAATDSRRHHGVQGDDPHER